GEARKAADHLPAVSRCRSSKVTAVKAKRCLHWPGGLRDGYRVFAWFVVFRLYAVTVDARWGCCGAGGVGFGPWLLPRSCSLCWPRCPGLWWRRWAWITGGGW